MSTDQNCYGADMCLTGQPSTLRSGKAKNNWLQNLDIYRGSVFIRSLWLWFRLDPPDLERYYESSVPDSIVSIIQYGEDEIHKSNIKDRVPAQDTNAWDAAEHQVLLIHFLFFFFFFFFFFFTNLINIPFFLFSCLSLFR